MFLASVFDEEGVDALGPYVPAFKVASYEMTHLPLLRYIGRLGKPVLLSTGTATMEEVEAAVSAFLETGNEHLALLQCTAAYPAPVSALNLRAICSMRERFNLPVGLSDHSRDPFVGPMAAVALGAALIEKHFTLSNLLPGPDHRFAVEPSELRQMILGIRGVEAALGSGEKAPHAVEAELRAFARRAIFTTRDIQPGEPFSRENIAVLRCGKLRPGLVPAEYERLLGRRASRHIAADTGVQSVDVT